MDQDLGVLVGDLVLDVGLELTAWDEDGAGDRALGVLVGFTDVEDDDVATGGTEPIGFLGVDLGSLMVGSIVTDLTFDVPSVPRPGEVILATAYGRYRGGKGYNQAVAAARLGAQVSMVGAVGWTNWASGP